jgi:hypothetical protein
VAFGSELFRATCEQLGNTVPLWIEMTDRVRGNFTVPICLRCCDLSALTAARIFCLHCYQRSCEKA